MEPFELGGIVSAFPDETKTFPEDGPIVIAGLGAGLSVVAELTSAFPDFAQWSQLSSNGLIISDVNIPLLVSNGDSLSVSITAAPAFGGQVAALRPSPVVLVYTYNTL